MAASEQALSLNSIVADFHHRIQQLQRRYAEWWSIVQNNTEISFGQSISRALALAIDFGKVPTPPQELIAAFGTALEQSVGLLQQVIEKERDEKDIAVAQIFLEELERIKNQWRSAAPLSETAETMQQPPPKSKGEERSDSFDTGKITWRRGSITDPVILEAADAIVLPASTTGTATKFFLSLAERFGMPAPNPAQPGEVISMSIQRNTFSPLRFAYWAYSVNPGHTLPNITRILCDNLKNVFVFTGVSRVNMPLLGTGAGELKPGVVARTYYDVFAALELDIRIVVSIPDKPFYDEVYHTFNKNTTGNSAPKNAPDIKSRLHTDQYSVEDNDVLQSHLVAENLFTILTDKDTCPPLNIGILAPWGHGKTSLMKRLQSLFDKKRRELSPPPSAGSDTIDLSHIRGWLKRDTWRRPPQVPYPTVWFNPWNYQSANMVWAGLADAIIRQVVTQLPSPAAQELFWMQLRLRRIDKDALRRDLQTRFFIWCATLLSYAVVALIVVFVFLIDPSPYKWLYLISGGGFSVVLSIVNQLKPYRKTIGDAFEKYTQPPAYTSEVGTFHQVREDMDRVMDLLVDQKAPLVIFVDDLDRCSASKVVEVIEAINVFISSGQYADKCYFILGMDAEMVAAALDVEYEKMKGRLGSPEKSSGSIGWYFMDKFIQLPFFIPAISETKKAAYLESLLKEENTAQKNERVVDTQKVDDVVASVLNEWDNKKTAGFIHDAGLTEAEKKEVDKKILENQVAQQKQNEDIINQVKAYAPYISADPRSMKRFTNLLRFYASYQFLRMKKGEKYAPVKVLAKWLAIMLKFPQFIRWIQWDAEDRSDMDTAEAKTKAIDALLEDFKKGKSNLSDKEYSLWLRHPIAIGAFKNEQVTTVKELGQVPLLATKDFYTLLIHEVSGEASLYNALECNVW